MVKDWWNNILWKTPIRPYVVLVMLGCMVWSGVIHSGYIALDTPWLVINNPILSTGSYNQLPIIFTDLSLGTRQTLGAEYLPFRDLSVLLDFAIFGDWLVGHHLHNLVLYLAACCVLLSLSFSIWERSTSVWLLVACYMLMPIHVESVAWLASRKDLLCLLFGLLSIHSYVNHKHPIVWATIWFICAYWSKNTATVIPVLLFFISLFYRGGDLRSWKWWGQWIPIAICQIGMLKLTMYVGAMMSMLSEPRSEGFFSILSITAQVWWLYLQNLLLPLSLSAYYVEPNAGWNLSAVAGGMLVLLGFCAPLFYRIPAFSLGLLWFFWGLLPVSQIVPIQNLIADRYLLFPSLAFVFVGYSWGGRKKSLILCCWGIFFAWGTWHRIPVWHNSISFWEDVTAKQPRLVSGWVRLAGQYSEQGVWSKAEQLLRTGQKFAENDWERGEIHQGLGLLAIQQKDYAQAELMLELAIHEDARLRKAQNNLIHVYKQTNQQEKAYSLAVRLCAEHPLYEVGWNSLGVLEMEKKEYGAARNAFLRALEITPFGISPLLNMGNVAFLEGKYEEAHNWWMRVVELEPSQSHAQAGLQELKRLGY